jgi:EAL domain-containing protein (putative c-di-GMP-specific phosphodiesterase class I)
MAQALGLDVIAEGVETADQLAFFKEHGCEKVQGFYLGRPMPADDFAAVLKKDSG